MSLNNYADLIKADFYKKQFSEIEKKLKNKKVIFYGAGEFFNVIDKQYNLGKHFNVTGISDKKFETEHITECNGYNVILPSELKNYDADVILLTLANPSTVLKILKQTAYKHIKEIFPLYTNISPLLKYDIKFLKCENNKTYYHLNEYNVDLVADEYYGIIEEVFFWEIYGIKNKFKFADYDLYDIGMNRAYTDIYFSLDKRCKKCFGFEPFKATYDFAVENVNLNPKLKSKIETFNIGLSDKNKTETVYFLPHRDGISSVNYDFIKNYAPEELDNLVKTDVKLSKASEVFDNLLKNNSSTHKILKLDAEGAEYEVLPDLYAADLLKNFNIIVGDMHILNSKSETMKLFEYMYKSGFQAYEIHQHEKTIDYIFYKDIELA